ncbi:MAG: TonB-dependent receptor [Bryobacteraceae bacterium]|jgi:hypothetical protein
MYLRLALRHLKHATFLFAILALLVLPAGQAWGQVAGSGTITGSVKDPSGAVVPKATVILRNTDTGIERRTESSDAGIYVATFLQPGHYEVRVSKTGLTEVVRTDLVLQVGQTMTIDFNMVIQATQQTITVTGAGSVVDTEKTEASQVVSEGLVNNLPIAGRRWDNFVLLTPNVAPDGGSGLISYRGISGLYNENSVDGANNNQAFFSEARGRASSGAYVYSLDSIREYQVSSSNYSAELGQAAGGVVNAVTKSGTNALHGDAFSYVRNQDFNALDSFPKSQHIYSQPIHQWNQFGGSLSGPILKDKLFYYVTYDGSRKINPVTYTRAVTYPLACPAQVSATLCAAANSYFESLAGIFPRFTNQDIGFAKLDYQLNSSNHLSTSFDFMDYHAPNAYSTGTSYSNSSSTGSVTTNGTNRTQERIFVANWDSTLSGAMVNNLRFQWGRDLEVTGANAPAPSISVANVMTYGMANALPRPAFPDEHRYQISDTLSFIHGRHAFKAGFDLNLIHELLINLYQGGGLYGYTGAAATSFANWVADVTGTNLGDGKTGRHWNTFAQVTDPITGVGKDDFYNNDFAGFVEDSWKATPKLTLNLGVRYDLQLVPQPPKPNTATPLTTLYSTTINIQHANFAPRIGIAWNLAKGTVLRAGYGMFYAKTQNSTYYAIRVENGVYQQTFNCSTTTCPTLTFPNVIFPAPGPTLAAPFPGALTPTVTTFAPPAATQLTHGLVPDFQNPFVHEGEVTFERQMPWNTSLSAAYVFSRGLHLPAFIDSNLAASSTTKSYDVLSSAGATAQTVTYPFYTSRIDPTGVILVGYSDVNSWYNSMVLTFKRPMSHGLEFLANYTLSKATDGGQVPGQYGTFYGTDSPVDPMNRKLEYGPSDLDQRHRFTGTVVWMPTIKTGNKAGNLILSGWALSSIVTMTTGQPLTGSISGYPSGGPDGGLTGGVVSNSGGNIGGRPNWLGRNIYNLPDFYNVDFRLARSFKLTEKAQLRLMGEAFNMFNHTNIVSMNTGQFNFTKAGSGACTGHANGCLVPNATFLAPTGTSNGLYGPRQLQISGRFEF